MICIDFYSTLVGTMLVVISMEALYHCSHVLANFKICFIEYACHQKQILNIFTLKQNCSYVNSECQLKVSPCCFFMLKVRKDNAIV